MNSGFSSKAEKSSKDEEYHEHYLVFLVCHSVLTKSVPHSKQ